MNVTTKKHAVLCLSLVRSIEDVSKKEVSFSKELKKKKKTIEYFLGNITGSIEKKTQDRKSCDSKTDVNLSLQSSLF
jgi:hypothetical protein